MPLLARHTPHLYEAGTDEAGRGCLAGPVVAAAVILPPGYQNDQLRDSKKLSPERRLSLAQEIREVAWCYGIAEASVAEIERYNILQASFLAMHRALDQLQPSPTWILVDGNRFVAYPQVGHSCLIKGDDRYLSIAAASVLAKTERDALMEQLAQGYPQYGWQQNKGYPTQKHRQAIQEHGICCHHRKTFRLR
ncbi:MAG: ribonuclease HII [Bernardetiaceae bacterium]